jgi:hypothetical protein
VTKDELRAAMEKVNAYLLCDACFRKLPKQEEKSCAHGLFGGRCEHCGKCANSSSGTLNPPMHCLGTKRFDVYDPYAPPENKSP